ncbi:MAG: cysteine synthase A [Sulfurospirillum sp.]|nr:MAG: cysteine synthase A [Sulfurospirillum sp.]
MKIADNITQLIGNTPLIRLKNFSNIIAKCEFMNPNSSIKDRIGFNMINEALLCGKIDKNTTLIEPTSGNTGIALASVAASLGMKIIITMPESMSIERRKVMSALGAKLVLTPANEGMKGAINKATEIQSQTENSYILQQFKNPANPEIHRNTTAIEILNDTAEDVDYFVAGVGTGGTITGVGEVLKKRLPDIQIIAVEPSDSAILSKNAPGPHKIQGIGAGFVPEILNTDIYDRVVQVSNEEAFETSREIAKKEGLLVGISSGANVYAAMQIAKENPGKMVVTILPDTAERYLSTELF